MTRINVRFLPSKIDMAVLKSLTDKQRKDLLSKGLDINSIEKSLRNDLEKASGNVGNPMAPVGGVTRDRSNLIPEKRTITRNGRQQLTTVWVNPDNNYNNSDDNKDNNDEDNQSDTQGGQKNRFVGSDGTRVSLASTDNNNFPYAVTVIDPDGQRSIKHVINRDLAMKEIKNLVGNIDQASERAISNNKGE